MANAPDLFGMISKLQFHYWFSDKTHTMDALVHNKCEHELLELTKAVAKLCGVAIKMETEPSGKGGLKSWLTLAAKSPKKNTSPKNCLGKYHSGGKRIYTEQYFGSRSNRPMPR